MRYAMLIAAAVLAAAPVVAYAQQISDPLQVRCQLLDGNDQPRTVFAPGDVVRPDVAIVVPWHRTGNKLKVEALLSAKLQGIRFATRLGDAVVEVPNRAVRQQIPGWRPEYEDGIAVDGFVIESHNLGLPYSFSIPIAFPDSNARFSLVATLAEGTPAAVTKRCEQTIRIVR